MLLFNVDWREEMLLYPVVKQAVSVLARVTAWGYVAVALLWLAGLLNLACGVALVTVEDAETVSEVGGETTIVAVYIHAFLQLLVALLLPCLYVSALWCHHVLLAGRGLVVTRWLLLLLLPFAFLHLACEIYTVATAKLLLLNQFILAPVLTTVLAATVVMNWGCMCAVPPCLRALLAFFGVAVVLTYLVPGSFVLLLLPFVAWQPLRALARYAPLVVSLPPVARFSPPRG